MWRFGSCIPRMGNSSQPKSMGLQREVGQWEPKMEIPDHVEKAWSETSGRLLCLAPSVHPDDILNPKRSST